MDAGSEATKSTAVGCSQLLGAVLLTCARDPISQQVRNPVEIEKYRDALAS